MHAGDKTATRPGIDPAVVGSSIIVDLSVEEFAHAVAILRHPDSNIYQHPVRIKTSWEIASLQEHKEPLCR